METKSQQCEHPGCHGKRVCTHYCRAHHDLICINGELKPGYGQEIAIAINEKKQQPPIIRMELDAEILASLLRSAADSVQAANAAGLKTILVNYDMTLRDFLRFCLGEAGGLENGQNTNR